MRFKSPIIGQGSGSVAGATYSHNKGGMYIRNRSIPTNPNTPLQQAVRSLVATLVNHWQSTLTAAQRDAWDVYAANVPLNDVFGDPRFRTGINHYVRSNTPLLQAGGTRIDAGPTEFNLGEFTSPSFAGDATNDEVDVTFDNTDDWAGEDNAHMMVWISPPQNPTINYYKGPYRYADKIDGNGTTPPTSPAAISSPFVITAGQKVFVKVSVVRADGRLSSPFRGDCIAA